MVSAESQVKETRLDERVQNAVKGCVLSTGQHLRPCWVSPII